jgi:hypothetical protein
MQVSTVHSLPLPDPSGFEPPVWTPKKTYPFSKTTGGGSEILWTPTAHEKFRKQTVVYQIKNKVNLKKYVGQAVDLFKRMATHRSKAKTNPDSELYRDLHDHPECFEVGAQVTQSPDKLESSLIKAKNTIQYGYNRRLGGGGGTSREKEPISPKAFEEALARFAQNYQTPKRYPCSKAMGRITHEAPDHVLQQKGVIYRILKVSSSDVHVYVGCTERTFVARLREHVFFATHATPRSSRLYRAFQRHTNKFFLSIIPNELFPANLPISVREKIVIQFYKNYGYKLYNSNHGGGGGAAKK